METTTGDLERAKRLDRLARIIRATAEAMARIPPRSLELSASTRFATQYNAIRAEALDMLPWSSLVPPEIPGDDFEQVGGVPAEVRYVELRTYVAQLRAIVDHAIDMEG